MSGLIHQKRLRPPEGNTSAGHRETDPGSQLDALDREGEGTVGGGCIGSLWSAPVGDYHKALVKAHEAYDRLNNVVGSGLFADRP